MSETDLVQAILVELSKRDCLVWRNNSGALYETYPVMRNGAQVFINGEPVYFRGRIVRFGLEGSADIVGWCRKCGRFIAPEGKAPRGRLSDAQIAWGAQAKSAGVVYCVARTVQDAIDVVEQHQRQHQRTHGG